MTEGRQNHKSAIGADVDPADQSKAKIEPAPRRSDRSVVDDNELDVKLVREAGDHEIDCYTIAATMFQRGLTSRPVHEVAHILQLRFESNLSTFDIAHRLGERPTTVDSVLHAAAPVLSSVASGIYEGA